MTEGPPRVPLPGSERAAMPDATPIGPVDAAEPLEVTVVVRRRAGAGDVDSEALGQRAATEREHLARSEFAAALGADPKDLEAVEEFGRSHGLTVVESSRERRSVVLAGGAAEVCSAFGVELSRYRHPDGDFRGRTGPVHLPAELADVVEGVFGLDDRPQAQPRFRIAEDASPSASFTPLEVAALYDFPTEQTGEGQCIGIIELGGGYDQADLRTFFSGLGLAVPSVTAVSVDGGRNAPTGDPNGPDAEVLLDIEVAGAIAPRARIAVYFAPNTDRGFIDAVTTAIHDSRHAPSVISISWGGPEQSWTPQARTALDQAFADAAALGVTVCAASGDNGAADGMSDGRAHVDFPSSSPHVLACGGTHLSGSGTKVTSETAWNDGRGGATGGGVSDVFGLPSWQRSAGVPKSANPGHRVGRGVPDVAGDADPASGYRVEVDRKQATIGGTSAVAPLWAGLIALLNQRLGKPVGYLNPLLYSRLAGTRAFRDITHGDNRVAGAPGYSAKSGWDACTGLGTPNGKALLSALAPPV